tara:strand:- start:12998 stop:13969 length:972 start_codon:yes stop_codon:yes gene_type:complete
MDVLFRSEDDAFKWLKRSIDDLEQVSDIKFEGWPVLRIKFEGRDFRGSVPTRIMPSILDFQKEVHRTYCILKYGDSNLKRLTAEERDRLEIVVKVEEGSSLFEVNLSEKFNEIVSGAINKMEGRHLVGAIALAALSFTAPTLWKDYLNHQAQIQNMETQVEMSELELEKLRIFREAAAKTPEVAPVIEGSNEFKNHTLHKLQPQDSVSLPGSNYEVKGSVAQDLTHKPREQSKEVRLDGEFTILSVESGKQDGYRIKAQRRTDEKTISVNIPDGTLTDQQKDTLKNNEWAKRPVLMSINAKELRGEITAATLVSVKDLPKKQE